MSEVLVTVSCITFNHEDYIAEAIESFLMQKTKFNFEVIIHDDNSQDRTTIILQEYQKKYPDIIRLILQKENQYSKGIKRMGQTFISPVARGKYIAICEGDDYWTDPYKLQKQVDYMEANPRCGMCFHSTSKIETSGNELSVSRPYELSQVAPTSDIIANGGGFIRTNSIMYRSSLMIEPPKFYEESPVGDYPLQMYLSTLDYAYYIDENMSVYRVGVEGSWSNKIKSDSKKNALLVGTLKTLDSFNQYTDGKFEDVINRKKLQIEFDILVLKRQYAQFKSSKYKGYYRELPLLEKMKINMLSRYPQVTQFIKKLIGK